MDSLKAIRPKDIEIELSDYEAIPSDENHYQVSYHANNISIEGLIRPNEEGNEALFNLLHYKNQHDITKKPSKSGLPLKALCVMIKKVLKQKLNVLKKGKAILTPNSIFELYAGKIGINHDQEKLEKYYKKLGFIQKEDTHYFSQSIESFLKDCEKFDK